MSINKLLIEILTKGAGKSEKQIKGVSNSLGGLAKKAGIAAAAYFGTSGLINGIKSSTDAFAKQELAEKKLRFAAGASTNELIRQAQALQQVTRFGDEAIIAQQAYVKSLGISTEQTKEIIAASVDLASAMNISLESAVMNTTKTLSGMQGELGEKLPAAFKELTAEQLKAGEGIVFIREQFKGTAEEEAQTLSGSLDQMSNAFGDLQEKIGEKLAPAISTLAQNFKELIEVDPSEEAIKERQEFEKLLDVVIDVDSATSSRKLAIDELQTNYPDYLKNIDIEKTTTEDLLKFKKESLGLMNEEIIAMVQREELIELERERFQLQKELLELEKERPNIIAFNSGNIKDLSEAEKEAAQNRLKDIEAEISLLDEVRKSYSKKTKTVVGGLKEENEQETKKQKALRILGDLSRNEGIAEARISQLTAVINTSEAITKFLAKGKWGQAALAGIMGAKEVATIESTISRFATGADYITSGPEMIMVGDNPSGQERVQVTPLGGDPNINGPQGGGMTINIQGSVIGTEDFTEQVLMPQIEEGLRLGNRI